MKINRLAFLCSASLLFFACGGETSSKDMASARDLSSSGDLATAAKIEGCGPADFVDKTAAGATVTPWDTSLGSTPVCFKIKVNQTVTWSPAPSASHPLRSTTGDSPSPIASDNAATVTFPSAGTFGFHCNVHLGIMHGAILVVP